MENKEIINLIKSAQAGDSQAISELFAAYKDVVYSIAMRETKNRALSDDIVQETFVEVILKINDLENPAAFPSWLKIVAYHQCTRHYKKKETVHETAAVENEDGLSVFDTVEEKNASFIPDEALDQKEFRATILEMIDTLPDAQRSALHMFYFEEMPLKDIAEVQGVSVNTANTRLNRGRLAMKDSVEKYEKKHGIRLHTIAFFPFFKWLFKGSEETMSAKSAAQVAQQIFAETGVEITTMHTSAFASTATVASEKVAITTGAKAITTGMWTKVVAGVAAASIAVSTPFVVSQIRDENGNPFVQSSVMSEPHIFQETQEIIPETISEETIDVLPNPALEYYLDFSKVWSIQKDIPWDSGNGYNHQYFAFAFAENGEFTFYFYQPYTDLVAGGYGTYSLTDAQLSIRFDDAEPTASYIYQFDPNTLQLTQISEKGLWREDMIGTTYYFGQDPWIDTVEDLKTAAEEAIIANSIEMGG